jgi:hypothetical protein
MQEKLITQKTAKKAEEKGFKPKTFTTKYTNDYLLGGKNTIITETCILLWMRELQNWLRDVHNIHVETKFYGFADLSCEYHAKVSFIKDGCWEYILPTKNKNGLKENEALEIALYESLNLIES